MDNRGINLMDASGLLYQSQYIKCWKTKNRIAAFGVSATYRYAGRRADDGLYYISGGTDVIILAKNTLQFTYPYRNYFTALGKYILHSSEAPHA
jgi:hypothetical protein